MTETSPPSPGKDAIPARDIVARSAELVEKVGAIYSGILKDASTKRMSQPEVKKLLVSGWNSGTIPRVVEGEHYRGIGWTLNILHGQIPTDIFDYFAEDEDFGVVMPNEDYPNGSVALTFPRKPVNYQPNPDDPDTFYVERFRLPQVLSRVNITRDQALLKQVSALMNPSR